MNFNVGVAILCCLVLSACSQSGGGKPSPKGGDSDSSGYYSGAWDELIEVPDEQWVSCQWNGHSQNLLLPATSNKMSLIRYFLLITEKNDELLNRNGKSLEAIYRDCVSPFLLQHLN